MSTSIAPPPTHLMMNTYRRWPVEFTSGRGAHLFDSNGRRYLDFMAGIAVASVGHAHPVVARAVAEQATRLIHCSNLYRTRPQIDLAERLSELTGGGISFFCNSGAEAVETALKLARRWSSTIDPQATRVVVADGSFHGRTYGSLSATGQPSKRTGFGPMLPGFTYVPFGDPNALVDAWGDDVAAVLLEPIQGEAGVVVPPAGYLTAVREVCKRRNALLILDEIQTGVGRTGRWFAHEHEGIAPDVVCVAKGLAAGLPIGACVARPTIAAALGPGDHGSTFGGGPVQCAAALATLQIIELEGLVEHAAAMGQRLRSGLESCIGERGVVRGRGLLIGVKFDRAVARDVVENALERGLLVNDATVDVVRVCPPLVITEQEIDDALELLGHAVEAAWGSQQ